VLAGFLWKIGTDWIQAFPSEIINIHPALLPKYGGKGMYGNNVHKAVKENKEKETGITIHYVNEEYDKGDFIFQESVEVSLEDNVDNIATKVHQLEHQHFPKVIASLLYGR
jgi:phosphoribosylglycinamide formyltransferase-1